MLCFSLLAFFLSHFASSLFSSLCVTGILMCQRLWGREVLLPYCCWCLSLSPSIIAVMRLDVFPSSYLSLGSIALDTSMFLSHHEFTFFKKEAKENCSGLHNRSISKIFSKRIDLQKAHQSNKRREDKKTNCLNTKEKLGRLLCGFNQDWL